MIYLLITLLEVTPEMSIDCRDLFPIVRIDVTDWFGTTYQGGVFISSSTILMSANATGHKYELPFPGAKPENLIIIYQDKDFILFRTSFINSKWVPIAKQFTGDSDNLKYIDINPNDFTIMPRVTEVVQQEPLIIKGKRYVCAILVDEDRKLVGLGYANSDKGIRCRYLYDINLFLQKAKK